MQYGPQRQKELQVAGLTKCMLKFEPCLHSHSSIRISRAGDGDPVDGGKPRITAAIIAITLATLVGVRWRQGTAGLVDNQTGKEAWVFGIGTDHPFVPGFNDGRGRRLVSRDASAGAEVCNLRRIAFDKPPNAFAWNLYATPRNRISWLSRFGGDV